MANQIYYYKVWDNEIGHYLIDCYNTRSLDVVLESIVTYFDLDNEIDYHLNQLARDMNVKITKSLTPFTFIIPGTNGEQIVELPRE